MNTPGVSEIQPSVDFYETYAECAGMLHGTVGSFCPPPAGTSRLDLEQAATLGLWRATENYNTSKSTNFEGYALRCMRNGIIDYIREIKKGQYEVYIDEIESDELESRFQRSSTMDPESRLLSKEWITEFAEQLSSLKPNLRGIFDAVEIGGMSLEDASNMLGVKKDSAKNSLQYTRAKLRQTVPVSPFVEY